MAFANQSPAGVTYLIFLAAADAAALSNVFDIRVYGSEKEKEQTMPMGVQRHGPSLKRDDKILDPSKAATRRLLFATTYDTYAARHGRNATVQFIMDNGDGINRDTALGMLKDGHIPSDWEGIMEDRFGFVVLGECQRM